MAVMDCTFLDEADRKGEEPQHSTLAECMYRAGLSGVQHLILAHISTRYSEEQAQAALTAFPYDGPMKVTLCPIDRPITL